MLKINKLLVLGLFVLLGFTQTVLAEETTAPAPAAPAATAAPAPAAPAPKWYDVVTVSGLVDAYYSYNGNGYRGLQDNIGLGFAPDSNEFSAALVELNIEKKPTAEHPSGFYIGLMGGTTAYLVDQLGDKLAYSGLFRQVYGSLLLSPNLQVDIGKYMTPCGAEVMESNGNWNYTRSLLYNYAEPVLHVGARATYTASESLSAQLHVVNGWNNVVNHTSGKGVGVQVAYAPVKPLPIVLNYMTTSESSGANGTGTLTNIGQRTMLDVVATYNLSDALAFMASFDSGSQSNGVAAGKAASWSGMALYGKYSGALPVLSAIAFRFESYNDPDGFTTAFAGGQTLTEATITLEKAIDAALLRLDIRQDSSNKNSFTVAGAANSQSQLTATLGAVFAF
jgi:hypothetical protein